jgi:hypothetical protein
LGQLEQGVHSYDPGIAPNGLFWTIPIPDDSVEINLNEATASMRLRNVPVFDWKTIPNSLLRGTFLPPVCATISFRVRWSGVLRVDEVRDETNRFAGRFIRDEARFTLTAEQPGFRFESDPARTSVNLFSEIGRERNGAFFSSATSAEEDSD